MRPGSQFRPSHRLIRIFISGSNEYKLFIIEQLIYLYYKVWHYNLALYNQFPSGPEMQVLTAGQAVRLFEVGELPNLSLL